MLKLRIQCRGIVYRDAGPFHEVMERLRLRWGGRSLGEFLSEEARHVA